MAFARAHPFDRLADDLAVDRHRPRAAVVNLGLVVPRYGDDVVGGTEHWLRMLCEHLVAMKQWHVEVFTTCATSAATWNDELPPGRLRARRRHRPPPSFGVGPRPAATPS